MAGTKNVTDTLANLAPGSTCFFPVTVVFLNRGKVLKASQRKIEKGQSITISTENRESIFEQEFLDLIKDDMARCALRYRAVVNNLNRKKVLSKRDYEILYSDVSPLYTENGSFLTSDIATTRQDCSERYEGSL